jgi:DNA-binding GntR family transcriptional regulator
MGGSLSVLGDLTRKEKDMMKENIYSTIRDRILSLDYKPGEILNEQSLAKEFGVSRTPLREVLTRLEFEKLVRILPRTGSLVTEIDLQQMINIFQIRLELEDLAGRLAAENVSEEHLTEIKNIQDECQKLYKNMNQFELANIDNKLRSVVYDAANNTRLTEISDSLHSQTQRLWSLIFRKGSWNGEVKAMMNEIIQTHEVLSKGDAGNAGLVRRHLLNDHVQRIKGKLILP